MQSTFSKILALILVPLFLITGVVSVPGYAWCLGDDDHLEIERFERWGCVDNSLNGRDPVNHNDGFANQIDEDHCGSCVDFYTQSHDVKTPKQLQSIPPAPIDTFPAGSFTQHTSPVAKMVVGNLAPQPPPRIPQTILTHRTIVLLI
jgi:hypothetical protein